MDEMDEAMAETTALIPKPQENAPTPLPKFQLAIIMFVQICEPTAGQSIYPYINQLISELDITGGDQRKVGYYAGLIESLFYITEAATVLQWSRASDYVGRKPILVIGLFGTTLSMLCFGLSRTFWMLVVSRCLTGLLNGNVGIMKSVLADLTDRSNRAQAVAFVPIVWDLGSALGMFLGGQLSQPQRRFPNLFPGRFWGDYPYFLPALATASLVCFSGLIVLLFFKETAPSKTRRTPEPGTSDELEDSDSHSSAPPAAPVSLLQLVTFPVMISVSNYIALAFLSISLAALVPLFFATPIEIGGLGLAPPKIGLIMAIQSISIGVFQLFFFAKITRRFGERAVMICGMSMFVLIFGLIPVISAIAQQSGRSATVWILVACLLSLYVLADMCYGVVWMFLTASAPKDSRGAVNGLGQTSVSVARAIGPAFSTSLFAVSLERNLLGGYAVYAILGVISVCAVMLARRLPTELWEEEDL
ncbi:major facilitator superfamily domain-containing protein [Mycena sanguinolenta]|nr:major facilitator superfamily domain-containing protein [Mycena sanguinolenta]KAJ6491897.1 major facilitator superfamily domain-containing protein [Mycena sanguinolenta]